MENLLTVEEVAPLIRFSEQGLYRAIRENGFPALKIGRQIRIPESALQRWIEEQLPSSTQSQTASKGSEAL